MSGAKGTPRPGAWVTPEGRRQIAAHLEELHVCDIPAIHLAKAYVRQLESRLRAGGDAHIFVPANRSKTGRMERAFIDHHGWSTEPYPAMKHEDTTA